MMTKVTTFSERAVQYADAIIGNKIPSCEYVKQACRRFIKDLKRKDIYLDQGKAEEWCGFLEKLPHVKGKWKGTKLKLSDWQIFCTVNIFGWYLNNSRRRFRSIYIEVGRKNGKSFWFGGIGVGMLAIDGEYGAEIYCGATTEDQAWHVFKPAKMICDLLPKLRKKYGIEVNAKTLSILKDGAIFKPVIGNPGDGGSPSCAIVDEYHEHKTSDMVDTFETGMGARNNPLMLQITTAGSDTGGPCYSKRDDVIQILKGAIEDDTIFGIIYTLDEGDDWTTVEAQKKANPNYGISIDPDFLKGQLNQARRSAIKQVAYKTKHLNLWVGAKEAWMNMLAYQACWKKLNIKDFKGRQCYAALDLSSKIDFACKVLLFPPEDGKKFAVFITHYLPEDRILEGGNTRYKAWHADGWITSTPGNVLDYSYIEDDLIEDKSNFEIIEVPYDPFQAMQFATQMLAEGFPMIGYGATVKNFSEPMKEIEALILKKGIEFQMDPVLMWMFGNVVARLDKKDNIFPNKERAENKIDGVVALIMAMGRYIVNNDKPSIYEERGIRML